MWPQDVWAYVYRDVFKQNDFICYCAGAVVWPVLLALVPSVAFMVVDLTGWLHWVLQYKIQEKRNVPVDKHRMVNAVAGALVNLLFWNTLFILLQYPIYTRFGGSSKPEDFPSLWRFLFDYVCITQFNEMGFYYTHRLLHWGPLYRRFHKQHHEWIAPVGIVAFYAHPVEHILSSILPYTMVYVLLGSHMFTIVIWAYLFNFTTVVHHSGYHLPFLSSPEFHDFHHLHFNCNYGAPTFDRLHGTDALWRKSKEIKRHQTFWTLTPPKQLYPD